VSNVAELIANRARKSAGISFWELREGRCRFPLTMSERGKLRPPRRFQLENLNAENDE
jgi:hypothetical protein